jgi:hypothetical protein
MISNDELNKLVYTDEKDKTLDSQKNSLIFLPKIHNLIIKAETHDREITNIVKGIKALNTSIEILNKRVNLLETDVSKTISETLENHGLRIYDLELKISDLIEKNNTILKELQEMAKLTTTARKKIPSKEFGEPGKRKYPLDTRARAANAKARATQMVKKDKLSSSEASKIKAKANKVLGKKSK